VKSLELNWIRKKCDKTLVMPEVMFFDMDFQGLYIDPIRAEYYDMDGHPVYAGFGIIIVNPIYADNIESILSHEWRHHWQLLNGMQYDGIDWNELDENDYEINVQKYFKESKSEMDALKFQYKHASISPLWEELLYQYL